MYFFYVLILKITTNLSMFHVYFLIPQNSQLFFQLLRSAISHLMIRRDLDFPEDARFASKNFTLNEFCERTKTVEHSDGVFRTILGNFNTCECPLTRSRFCAVLHSRGIPAIVNRSKLEREILCKIKCLI